MDLGLTGKRALVTGSTKGLGLAIAERLLAEGASVAIGARTEADVDQALIELSHLGHVIGAVLDAADLESVDRWIYAAAHELGGIDIYVHNTSGKPARKLDGWVNNYRIDLMALIAAVESARKLLIDGGGSLISIGTTASAEHFASGTGSYTAFKAAVTNWTLGQAQVLGAQGVRCNVVSPGPIMVDGGDWDFVKQNQPDFFADIESVHPGGQLGEPRDVANAVAFLCSDSAKHINGVNLTVDGGFLKRVNY